jgi:hypothetical protein
MTHPNSAKTDGVELETNLGCVYVEDDKEENVHACFPLVSELAKHIGLGRENAMKIGEVSGAKSSGSTKGGEVSGADSCGSTKIGEVLGAESSGSTKGGEVSGAESSGSTKSGEISREKSSQSTKSSQFSRQKTSKEEDDEESEGPPGNTPNLKDPTPSIDPQDEEEKTFTVNVYLKAEKLSFALKGQRIRPSICPTMVFKF